MKPKMMFSTCVCVVVTFSTYILCEKKKMTSYFARLVSPDKLSASILLILLPSRWSSVRDGGRPEREKIITLLLLKPVYHPFLKDLCYTEALYSNKKIWSRTIQWETRNFHSQGNWKQLVTIYLVWNKTKILRSLQNS